MLIQKTRLQVIKGDASMSRTIASTWKNEGVLLASFTPTFPFALPTGSPNAHAQLMGFYKGITPPLAAETVYNLLYFLSYGCKLPLAHPQASACSQQGGQAILAARPQQGIQLQSIFFGGNFLWGTTALGVAEMLQFVYACVCVCV